MARKKKEQYPEKITKMAHDWNMLIYEFEDKHQDLYLRYINLVKRMNNELTVAEYNQMLKIIEETKWSCADEYFDKKAEKQGEA